MPQYATIDDVPSPVFLSLIGTVTAAVADLDSPYSAVASSCHSMEEYYGSRGKTFVYDFSSDKWVRSEASKRNNFAVQMNTNDFVSGDNVNELGKLVVSPLVNSEAWDLT